MAFNADEFNFEFILAIQGYNNTPMREREKKRARHMERVRVAEPAWNVYAIGWFWVWQC